jgi:hypothetical protein
MNNPAYRKQPAAEIEVNSASVMPGQEVHQDDDNIISSFLPKFSGNYLMVLSSIDDKAVNLFPGAGNEFILGKLQ